MQREKRLEKASIILHCTESFCQLRAEAYNLYFLNLIQEIIGNMCLCVWEWMRGLCWSACVLLKTHHPPACLAHFSPPALPLTAGDCKHNVGTWMENITKYSAQIHLLFSLIPSQTGSGKALSRLKHLQQSGSEKSKTSKQREDFLKNQGQQQVWF